MKCLRESTVLLFDVLEIAALLLFSIFVVLFSLLAGPGYWGPTIGLLANAGSVGTILYLIHRYDKIISNIIRYHSFTRVDYRSFYHCVRFCPGKFSEVGVLLPKLIVLVYPILFLIGVVRKEFGDRLFKGATVVYMGIVTGYFSLFLINIHTQIGAYGGIDIATVAFLVLLFCTVLYPLYRLLFVDGFSRVNKPAGTTEESNNSEEDKEE